MRSRSALNGVDGDTQSRAVSLDEVLGELEGWHYRRPGFHHRGDDLVVHFVAVIDDVDTELEGHQDGRLVDCMSPDEAPGADGRRRWRRPARSRVISMRSLGALVPWPPDTSSLITCGTPLDLLPHAQTGSRRRRRRGEARLRVASPSTRGRRHCSARSWTHPGGRPEPWSAISPSSMARFNPPSMSCDPPAATTPVNHARARLEVSCRDQGQVRGRVLVAVWDVGMRTEFVVGGSGSGR